MQVHLRSILFVAIISSMLGGCGGESEITQATEIPATAVGANDEAPPAVEETAAPANEDLSLAPLPLAISAPPNDSLPASLRVMDMSLDAHHSVTVQVTDTISLNVSTPMGTFDELKTAVAEDTILHPFAGWEREEAATAVFRFTEAGATRYHGFTMVEIAGATYQCKTVGLEGLATAAEVDTALAACADIHAAN